MRPLCLFWATCLPVAAGTISTSVSAMQWPVNLCSQSSVTYSGLFASSTCLVLGASVTASQNGWNASVMAGRNLDGRVGLETRASLTYHDSLIITGDTGSGFIRVGNSPVAFGQAWVNYVFAGQWIHCSSYTCAGGVTIPVTFGVPFDVQWSLDALGGCS